MSDQPMRQIFESTIERLLADISTPAAVLACESGTWPAALWRAVEASGFALAAAPEARGGAGASWADLFVVLVACGRHSLPLPLPEAMLANWLLGSTGLNAVSGPLSFATASTITFADGRVSGWLRDVPWGRHVNQVVAVADDVDNVGAANVLLLATKDSTQQTLRQNMAGEPRDDLEFAGATPLAIAALPSHLARDVLLQGGALLRAAQSAGALQALLEMSTRHATERVQFGQPIGSFQAIGHQIAVLAEHVALASITAEAACAESNETGLAWLPIAAAKVCSAEAAGIAAGIAHAVHGAMGFTHEHRLHLSTRRLWAWRSEYGSLTEWSQRIGRAACSGGATELWPAITHNRWPHSIAPL